MASPWGCRSINTIVMVQFFYRSQWKDADHFQKDDYLHNKDGVSLKTIIMMMMVWVVIKRG